MMATEYRRKIGTQVWHFRRDCLLWPKPFDFVVLFDRPHDQQICHECIALAQHNQVGTPIISSTLPSILRTD